MSRNSTILLGIISLLVGLILWMPLGLVMQKGFSLESMSKLFAREDILWAFFESFLLALSSAFLATLLGTMIAFSLPRLNKVTFGFIQGALIFPMVLPEIAIGLSFMVWFIKVGMPLGWGTLLSSHVAFSLSYAVLMMKVCVESLDHNLIDAAKDLGANAKSVFRHAVFPQLKVALVASFLTCFSLSLDDFLISFFVKGIDQRTLPIQIYSMMRVGLSAEIYALSVILFCISVIVVLSTQIWKKQKK